MMPALCPAIRITFEGYGNDRKTTSPIPKMLPKAGSVFAIARDFGSGGPKEAWGLQGCESLKTDNSAVFYARA
jgi:hypothetical protein